MLFGEFYSKLRELNPSLRIETGKAVIPYHSDFPISGIYDQDKFLLGMCLNHVPEYTLMGVDTDRLAKFGKKGFPEGGSGQYVDKEDIDKIKAERQGVVEERILARGYRYILSKLVAKGKIDQHRAEKKFHCTLYPQMPDEVWPKRYIALGFEGK